MISKVAVCTHAYIQLHSEIFQSLVIHLFHFQLVVANEMSICWFLEILNSGHFVKSSIPYSRYKSIRGPILSCAAVELKHKQQVHSTLYGLTDRNMYED